MPDAADPRAPRVAVIGAGHLGSIHAKILASRAALACVVDAAEERAAKLAGELGCAAVSVDPARGGSVAEFLPRDVDAAIVAVPTSLHADVACPLLERGLACLVEKPLAADLADARRILDAARRGRATLAVGHVERFQPGVRRVRAMGIAPRFIECHRLAPFSFRSTDIGVVHDLMIHDLDLVLHLVGSEVESFDAAGGAILTDREDMASVRIVFRNGARANVTASRASLSPMRRFRLFSSTSYVSLDLHKNYGLMVRKGPRWDEMRAALRGADAAELAARTDFASSGMLEVVELELSGMERPLQAELDHFLECVRTGAAPEVTGADGYRALELAERVAAAIGAQPF
jgi:predicted dehydrogenase